MKYIFFILFFFFILNLKAEEDYQFILLKGVEALRSRDMLKGIEMMNSYLKGYPNSPYALSNRGMAYYQMGDIENACQDLNLAKVYGFEQRKQFTSYFCDPAYKLNLMKEEYYKEQTLLPENGNRPLYTRRDSLRGALRPERTCFDVYFYDLSVRIKPHTKKIAGNNRILFHVLNET